MARNFVLATALTVAVGCVGFAISEPPTPNHAPLVVSAPAYRIDPPTVVTPSRPKPPSVELRVASREPVELGQ